MLGQTSSGANILQWQNGGKAVVEGLEGNLTVPVIRDTLTSAYQCDVYDSV